MLFQMRAGGLVWFSHGQFGVKVPSNAVPVLQRSHHEIHLPGLRIDDHLAEVLQLGMSCLLNTYLAPLNNRYVMNGEILHEANFESRLLGVRRWAARLDRHDTGYQ